MGKSKLIQLYNMSCLSVNLLVILETILELVCSVIILIHVRLAFRRSNMTNNALIYLKKENERNNALMTCYNKENVTLKQLAKYHWFKRIANDSVDL